MGNMPKQSKTPGEDDVTQEMKTASASANLNVGHVMCVVDAEDASLIPFRVEKPSSDSELNF
jgi:hypothetical protein